MPFRKPRFDRHSMPKKSSSSFHVKRDYPKGAVVAVIFDGSRFLTIKRSRYVKAPSAIGFAGGGVEPDEEQDQAIVREMKEELGVDVVPIKRVWKFLTARGVELNFWQVKIVPGQTIRIEPDEIEMWAWHTPESLRQQHNLISSAIPFLDCWEAGEISLESSDASSPN
jgi:8-oxo-dGTP pyrophosphatase MutT (NUDIX family)